MYWSIFNPTLFRGSRIGSLRACAERAGLRVERRMSIAGHSGLEDALGRASAQNMLELLPQDAAASIAMFGMGPTPIRATADPCLEHRSRSGRSQGGSDAVDVRSGAGVPHRSAFRVARYRKRESSSPSAVRWDE